MNNAVAIRQRLAALVPPSRDKSGESLKVFEEFKLNIAKLLAEAAPLVACQRRVRSFVPELTFDSAITGSWDAQAGKE